MCIRDRKNVGIHGQSIDNIVTDSESMFNTHLNDRLHCVPISNPTLDFKLTNCTIAVNEWLVKLRPQRVKRLGMFDAWGFDTRSLWDQLSILDIRRTAALWIQRQTDPDFIVTWNKLLCLQTCLRMRFWNVYQGHRLVKNIGETKQNDVHNVISFVHNVVVLCLR